MFYTINNHIVKANCDQKPMTSWEGEGWGNKPILTSYMIKTAVD